MDFLTAYNLTGLVIGLGTFAIIGLFHPMVIKGEYYFGVGCWRVFLAMGILALVGSILVHHLVWSTMLAVWGASSFWSIGELFEQRKRVEKGWFPANPKRKRKRRQNLSAFRRFSLYLLHEPFHQSKFHAMDKSIKGTRTEQNLLKAFAGESQARTRYTFFASQAKKEGFEQIAGVFSETADQEKEHAKRFFKFLEGGDVAITASYPTGPIGTTQENLLAAAQGEREEWDVLYRDFAKIAEEEGFPEVAAAFKMIATVEAEHESRYLKLLSRLTDGNFFRRDGQIWWQCRNCGYVCLATEAPKLCPACLHGQAYFEPKKENY